jgi:dTDP-glucose 4,6-dehydratase
MSRVLVTGAAGFIGHHLVERILSDTKWSVTCLDRLDHAGNLERLVNSLRSYSDRVRIVYHDLRAEIGSSMMKRLGTYDYCLHLAAGSHVDRSVQDPSGFVRDNVLGTAHLLDYCRYNVARTLYFSTDEIFGSAEEGQCFQEGDRFNPTNPYSASKAGGELLVPAYANTYGMKLQITRCANVFGERQDPEKFIPLVIRKVLAGETVQIHSREFYEDLDGSVGGYKCKVNKISSRLYTHHRNVTSAVLKVLESTELVRGEHASNGRFNIESGEEQSNLFVAQEIARLIGKPLHYELVQDPPGRPRPDMRYSIDSSKLRRLGWEPEIDFASGLEQVVKYELEQLRS